MINFQNPKLKRTNHSTEEVVCLVLVWYFRIGECSQLFLLPEWITKWLLEATSQPSAFKRVKRHIVTSLPLNSQS